MLKAVNGGQIQTLLIENCPVKEPQAQLPNQSLPKVWLLFKTALSLSVPKFTASDKKYYVANGCILYTMVCEVVCVCSVVQEDVSNHRLSALYNYFKGYRPALTHVRS